MKSRITRNWIIFDGSYIIDYQRNFRYVKDYILRQDTLCQDPVAQKAAKELDMFWIHDLWISLIWVFLVMCIVGIIHKKIADNIRRN